MSPAAAAGYPLSSAEKQYIEQNKSWHLRGSIQRVKEVLIQEKELNGFDELMICTIPFSQEFKLKEYKLIAKHIIED